MKPVEFKAWRRQLTLTQDEIANQLMVLSSTIDEWESGVREIPPMIEAKCYLLLERHRQEDDFGPVILVYYDRPLWQPDDRTIPNMVREAHINNRSALQRLFLIWNEVRVHNPVVIDERADIVWGTLSLRREFKKRFPGQHAGRRRT